MDTIHSIVVSMNDEEWQDIIEWRRFWRQVDTSGGDDACWKWTGCIDKASGYGVGRYKKKTNHAHRIAYILAIGGDLTSDIVIRHKCDNRVCCNPKHLEPGSHADNIRDRIERKGDQQGENNYAAKLTEEQVSEIRVLHKQGVKQLLIADKFNVSNGTISMIVRGITWSHSKK